MEQAANVIELTPERHLASKAREVLVARQKRDDLKARLKAMQDRFEARLAPFRDQMRELEYEVTVQETMARDLALELYERDGDKDVGCGLKVRVVRVVKYDPDEARSWALTSAEDLLILDNKRFEKGVRDGVITSAPAEVVETPQVTIAADLAQALAEYVDNEPEPDDRESDDGYEDSFEAYAHVREMENEVRSLEVALHEYEQMRQAGLED